MSKVFNDINNIYKKGSVITKLVFVNVVAFVVMMLLTLFIPSAENYFSVPGTFAELIYQPWTIITYMFLHGGFWHLAMNMLWLFWFGQIFLQYFNNKQFFAVFLMGGFAGAFLHLGINQFLPPSYQIGIIGSSAAVMSIVFAAAAYRPEFKIHLIFIGPVKIKYLAMIAFAFDIMGLLSNLNSTVGMGDGVAHIAHIGGALYGLWFAYNMKKAKDITRSVNNFLDSVVSLFTSSKHDRNRSKMSAKRIDLKNQKETKKQ